MAASTRITYIAGSPLGGIHLAAAVRLTIQAKQEINRAQAIAAAVTAGGATQSNLEGSAEFGAAAGQGAVLYSAIATLQSKLAAVLDSDLANLDQG